MKVSPRKVASRWVAARKESAVIETGTLPKLLRAYPDIKHLHTSDGMLREWYASPRPKDVASVALVGGVPVGVATVVDCGDPDRTYSEIGDGWAWLPCPEVGYFSVFVERNMRGQGLANRLFRAVLPLAKRYKFIAVTWDNQVPTKMLLGKGAKKVDMGDLYGRKTGEGDVFFPVMPQLTLKWLLDRGWSEDDAREELSGNTNRHPVEEESAWRLYTNPQ